MSRRLVCYFLFSFVVLMGILSIHAVSGTSVNTVRTNMVNAFIFSLIGALIIGTIAFFYEKK